jgi:hypothetical protein
LKSTESLTLRNRRSTLLELKKILLKKSSKTKNQSTVMKRNLRSLPTREQRIKKLLTRSKSRNTKESKRSTSNNKKESMLRFLRLKMNNTDNNSNLS